MTRAELGQDPGFLGFVRGFLADWISAGGSLVFVDFITFGREVLAIVSTDQEIATIIERPADSEAELAINDAARVTFSSDLMGRI